MQNKILIIEDDPFSANLYKHHFDQAGYISQIAINGRIALDLLDSFHPDLIILDLILPKINGFTLLHFFKKIPVIIVSNLEHEEIAGVKLFITKESLDYQKLLTKIKELLHHHTPILISSHHTRSHS